MCIESEHSWMELKPRNIKNWEFSRFLPPGKMWAPLGCEIIALWMRIWENVTKKLLKVLFVWVQMWEWRSAVLLGLWSDRGNLVTQNPWRKGVFILEKSYIKEIWKCVCLNQYSLWIPVRGADCGARRVWVSMFWSKGQLERWGENPRSPAHHHPPWQVTGSL